MGFIQSRQLMDNVMWLCHIVNYTQDSGTPLLLFFCDAEKAFDRVQWEFLMAVLQRMRFGTCFITCIKYIYMIQ